MVSKGLQLFAVGCGILLAAGVVDSQAAPVSGGSGHPVEVKDEATQTTWYVDAELIHLLEKEAVRAMSAALQHRDDHGVIDVKISIDMTSKQVLVTFGNGLFQCPGDVHGESLLNDLARTLRHHLQRSGFPVAKVNFSPQGGPMKQCLPSQ